MIITCCGCGQEMNRKNTSACLLRNPHLRKRCGRCYLIWKQAERDRLGVKWSV